MKRTSLLVLILVALVTAVAAMPMKGRCPRRADCRTALRNTDPLASATALRWRQGQHAHWRACMLNH